MSEETEKKTDADSGKPAAVPVKSAAKKAAPKKTAASGSNKPARKTTTTKTAKASNTPKKTSTKTGASKRATGKKTAATDSTVAGTAAAAASAPQHGDVLEEAISPNDTADPGASEQTQSSSAGEEKHFTGNHDPYSADNIASELRSKNWADVLTRGAFTLFYMFASWVGIMLGFGLSVIQFLIYLISGSGNDVIRRAILSIGHYIGDVASYVSFASDERPFPFGKDLPEGE